MDWLVALKLQVLRLVLWLAGSGGGSWTEITLVLEGECQSRGDISTHDLIASHQWPQHTSVRHHLDRIKSTGQRWDYIAVVLTVMGWLVAARRGRKSVPIGGSGVRVHS